MDEATLAKYQALDRRMVSPSVSRAFKEQEEQQQQEQQEEIGVSPLRQQKLNMSPGGAGKEKKKRKRNKYSAEEDRLLLEAYERLGNQWKTIVEETGLERTPESISRRLSKIRPPEGQRTLVMSQPPSAQSSPVPAESKRLKALEDQLEMMHTRHNATLEQLREEKNQVMSFANSMKQALHLQLRNSSVQQKAAARRSMALASLRLGSIKWQQARGAIMEVWAEGSAYEELKEMERAVSKEEAALGERRKQLTAFKRSKQEKSDSNLREMAEMELVLKMQQADNKRRKADLERRFTELERETHLHKKEMKRLRDEDASRFNNNPIFKRRYVLLELLGKGGFSEVYRAYDLDVMEDVAIKIHQLDQHWSQRKKENYQKHALRELEIQKGVEHPRIVQLFDNFVVDANTWVTVMSYCPGNDLDFYLKQNGTVSEKEARVIMVQVLSALEYLHARPKPVIHYDLKPANILFNNYEVKLTDFGLSKVMADADQTRMELTSQGAGTYWYLPPECFQPNADISTKVDVWSVGVILFQLLYGKKPFGDSLSQQALLQQGLISASSVVEFPEAPKLSTAAKDFISCCLTTRPDLRPSVPQLQMHQFVAGAAFKKPK